MGKRKLAYADSSQSKIQKLTTFGFSSNAGSNESSALQKDETVQNTKPSTPKRKFNVHWKFNRDWLRYDSKLGMMFCDLCISANVCNVFTQGTCIMKKEAVTKHEKGTGDNSHSAALQKSKSAENMETVRQNALSKSKSAVIAALRNTYFAASNDLPNSMISRLNNLCIEQGNSQLKDLRVDAHTTYESNSSVQEFQQSLSDVILDRLLDNW